MLILDNFLENTVFYLDMILDIISIPTLNVLLSTIINITWGILGMPWQK